jgi:hypothetical protein
MAVLQVPMQLGATLSKNMLLNMTRQNTTPPIWRVVLLTHLRLCTTQHPSIFCVLVLCRSPCS